VVPASAQLPPPSEYADASLCSSSEPPRLPEPPLPLVRLSLGTPPAACCHSRHGRPSTIRADEGSPITVGEDADIEGRVTFHALKGTELKVGDRLTAGDHAILHGPLEVGDDLRVGDRGVVFRVRVVDDVTAGEEAIVAGPAGDVLADH
jgi:hypothetical protein